MSNFLKNILQTFVEIKENAFVNEVYQWFSTKISPLNIDLFKPLSANLGPGHMYPDIFENGNFILRFPKKKNKRIHTWRIRIVFACPHQIAKTMEIR